ncbi:hypothetical protein PG996_013975 [Apiospora saccharicola]|uniref:Uncharacterized protein n=1 Tax=Apiospora saccharicola TaxID=335842 RepID=A0ABR1TGY6_9PEZI
MAVRLSLVAQYCSNFWLHYQKGRSKRYPILAAAAVHFLAAMVYLGIAFRFDNNHNSRAHVVWYIGSALEAVVELALACRYEVLSFDNTKLTERMAVFTVVILGEGISGIVKTILLVDENGADWNSGIRGVFTAAVATTYFLFLLYFDWMDHHHLQGYWQLIYALFHFPFHAALLLFGAGSTLLMRWFHTYNVIKQVSNVLFDKMYVKMDDEMTHIIKGIKGTKYYYSFDTKRWFDTKSEVMEDSLRNMMLKLNAKYPVQSPKAFYTFDSALWNIGGIPDYFWNKNTTDRNYTQEGYNKAEYDWKHIRALIYSEAIISVMETFKVSSFGLKDNDGEDLKYPNSLDDQNIILLKTVIHVETTFQYTFACAGLVLLLMTFFHFLTLPKIRYWKSSEYIRIGIFVSAGLALGLLPLISTDSYREEEYYTSPWVLPTICLVVFFVFVCTHVRKPKTPLWNGLANGRGGTPPERLPYPNSSSQNLTGREGYNHGNLGITNRSPTQYISLQNFEHDSGRSEWNPPSQVERGVTI